VPIFPQHARGPGCHDVRVPHDLTIPPCPPLALGLLLSGLAGCTAADPPPTTATSGLVDSGGGTDSSPETGQTDSVPGTADSAATDSDDSEPLQADLIVLVGIPNEEVRFLVRGTGEPWATQRLRDWLPDNCGDGTCRLAGFQHGVVDNQDVMTFAYSRPEGDEGQRLGGVISARLGSPGDALWEFIELDFDAWLPGIYGGRCEGNSADSHCRMANPHTVLRLPDRNWLVADTAQDRLLILEAEPEDLSTTTPKEGTEVRIKGLVRQVIDATTQPSDDWGECDGPNNAEEWVEDGVTYALMTCRGDVGDGGGTTRHGSITLWDLRDLSQPQQVWRYPRKGFLKAVHHGRVLDGPDGPLLVYGHSMGDSSAEDEDYGTVGLARFSVSETPKYIGDGRLPAELGQLGFVRSISLLPDGQGLFVADSGCEIIIDDCQATGRLIEMGWPGLEPSGLAGGWSGGHEEQAFFTLDVKTMLEGEVLGGLPYEAEILAFDALGEGLLTRGGVAPGE
jgi:hypothetical protein